ncbi:TatD family hydrolase [endosymbiont of unidentified scaly snail isolate Monju]|uniref:TatD family hydrolase n=1 Tax=endosymbiont of unidentified scaly snail isolate Monju TaxID=1248727 RepID=UPI00038924AF|nr:TatD family hydrolase [endosymbiont of unidentified scaly snail isolate Monju]BAN69268.1 TatD DNase family protein [endosymbiont of unidentified scaly snail isolate Monju]
MELFDTHCHLDVAAFDPDRDSVLAAARAAGVRHLLIPAITRAGWEGVWALCAGDPDLYPAIGLHPVLLEEHDPQQDLLALEDFVRERRPAAIGEIGLDFQLRELDRARQQALFEAQLAIAEREGLPVVVHVRKAHDAVLATLQRYKLPGGVCHAFNGSLQQAARYRELGFRLGFGGMLTLPNARHLRELATRLPLSDLVLETDAPDMSGAAHRYQRNSPQWLPEVLDVLAELRPETREAIARQTSANALAVLAAGRVGA